MPLGPLLLFIGCKEDPQEEPAPLQAIYQIGNPNVAIQVLVPETNQSTQTPIVIQAPGMHTITEGTLTADDEEGILKQGAILVTWLVPGECDPEKSTPEQAVCSEGPWDDRGAATTQAFLTVLDWVFQDLPILYPQADPNNTGILSLSAGGQSTTFALAQTDHPIAWWVAWEAPMGDQFMTGELGREIANPGYVPNSCKDDACEVDWSNLRWHATGSRDLDNPTATDGSLFTLQGVFYQDANQSGQYEDDEFSLIPHVGLVDDAPRVFFSRELTPFSSQFHPEDQAQDIPYATPEETAAFWPERDAGSAGIDAALARHPGLKLNILAGRINHVAGPDDHPQIFTLWDLAYGHPSQPIVSLNELSPEITPSYEALMGALSDDPYGLQRVQGVARMLAP